MLRPIHLVLHRKFNTCNIPHMTNIVLQLFVLLQPGSGRCSFVDLFHIRFFRDFMSVLNHTDLVFVIVRSLLSLFDRQDNDCQGCDQSAFPKK